MKIKHIVLSLALAAATGSANAAVQIHDYHFGNVTNTSVSPTDAFENGGLGFFTVAGNFIDNLFFNVTENVVGSGQVFEFQVPGSDIIDMSVSLHSASPTAGFPVSFIDLGSNLAGSVFVGSGNLPTGAYFFQITGTATTSSAKYLFSAATVPVPEAETWAMMAVGLGLVGLQLRRRAKKTDLIVY